MGLAIGTLELNSVASGVVAGDEMLKSADVQLVMAQPVCPGKYVMLVAGDTSSVETAIAAGKTAGREKVVDSIIISSIAPEVIPAIMRSTAPEQREAVGVIETYSLASAILAADYAVKSAAIDLIEVRLGRGLGGKAFVLVTGSISDVTTAADTAKLQLGKEGMILNIEVIPSLHKDMYQALM
jgi:microcompartment protein CcmL/EutN